MSSEIDLLDDGLRTLLARFPTTPESDGALDLRLWRAINDSGLDRLLVSEREGGAELAPGALLPMLRRAAGAAACVPFAEGSLAAGLLERAGLALPDGPLTVADPLTARLDLDRQGDRLSVEGELPSVSWGVGAEAVVTVAEVAGTPTLLAIPATAFSEVFRSLLSPEPCSDLSVPRTTLGPGHWCQGERVASPFEVRCLGALYRAAGMAGALDRVLELCLEHARGREQFGRPIGRFQAVQQQLAVLAGEVAIASTAVAALGGVGWQVGDREELAIAAARVRIGRAASTAATIAHQVHGAIGFTREHELQRFSRRLWSWRDDFGDERWWADRLGVRALEAGPEGLWPLITGTP